MVILMQPDIVRATMVLTTKGTDRVESEITDYDLKPKTFYPIHCIFTIKV